MDRFKTELDHLKAEGLLPPDFDKRFTAKDILPNEKEENVQVVDFKRVEDVIDGIGALLVSREHLLRQDLSAQGIDPDKISPEELQFWTYIYFNNGSGAPEDPKGTGRGKLLDSLSKGTGTAIPT